MQELNTCTGTVTEKVEPAVSAAVRTLAPELKTSKHMAIWTFQVQSAEKRQATIEALIKENQIKDRKEQ